MRWYSSDQLMELVVLERRKRQGQAKFYASAFAGAISMIEQRWGKLVVHQNLLVARVRDLSLKVAIQKAFADSGKVVFLPDNFIAFPNDLTKKMEALVNKSGYVVKAIEVRDSEKINYP